MNLNSYATNNTKGNNELIRMTDNRKEWRAMVVDVCTRHDT